MPMSRAIESRSCLTGSSLIRLFHQIATMPPRLKHALDLGDACSRISVVKGLRADRDVERTRLKRQLFRRSREPTSPADSGSRATASIGSEGSTPVTL